MKRTSNLYPLHCKLQSSTLSSSAQQTYTLEAKGISLLHPQAAQGAAVSLATSGLDKWRWTFNGGRPAAPPRSVLQRSELLFTAHKDGRVRVWGCATAALDLHATVPFDSGGAGARLRAVSALEVLTF